MSRRKKKEEHINHERWLVSYADFITLLFAFFTIMFATSQQDTEKAKSFENSIKQYLIHFGAFGGSGPKVNQGEKYNSPIAPPIKSFPKGNAETQKIQLKVETYLEEKLTQSEMEKMVKDISNDSMGVRISLAASEIFPSSSVKFKRGSLSTLNKVAQLLKETSHKIVIEGHMDSQDDKYASWETASLRSTQIVKYLMKVHGISGKRLAAISYGAERPMFPNDTKKNRERNRRIDFLIVTADSPL